VFTRRQRQALAAVSNPLKDAGILHQVFTFLPGSWLFLGAVCRDSAAVYATLKDQKVPHLNIEGDRSWRSYGPKATLYGNAVASPATAHLAFEAGLDLQRERSQFIAGLCADITTLVTLRELGMPFEALWSKQLQCQDGCTFCSICCQSTLHQPQRLQSSKKSVTTLLTAAASVCSIG
jgi:hypothetical protein